MTGPQEISIVQAISQAREEVFATLTSFTGGDFDSLARMPEIVNVLQTMPPQLVPEVALPILEDFAAKHGDPGDSPIDLFGMFDRILAANISMATNYVIQNIREQQARAQRSQQKLSQGLLGT